MLVVTTDELPGWEIQRVCGEVFGLAIRAGVAPGAEGEKTLAESRTEVLSRMLEHARTKGGNVVVGLRFDAATLGDAGTELCAYGTAVVAVPMDEGARQTATALGYGQPGGSPSATEPAAQQQQQYDPAQQQPYAGYGQPPYDPNQQPAPQGYPPQDPPQGYPQPTYQQYPPQGYPQQ